MAICNLPHINNHQSANNLVDLGDVSAEGAASFQKLSISLFVSKGLYIHTHRYGLVILYI